MWQSREEIEQYFIAYFNLVTEFVRNSPILHLRVPTFKALSAAASAISIWVSIFPKDAGPHILGRIGTWDLYFPGNVGIPF